MIRIETERLLIRNFTIEDIQGLYAIAMDYEKSDLAQFDHGPWPSDIEEHKKIVKWFAEGDDFVAVVLKESKKLIGFISKGKKEGKENEYEFGYIFHSNYHGKGYASESCKAVIDYMFEVLEAERISSGTAKVNKPSNALLLKLGFRMIGEKTRSFREDSDGNKIEFVGMEYLLSKKA